MRSLCLRPEDFGRQESGTDIGAPAAAAGARRAASGCAECVCEMPANQPNLEVRGASARRSSEGVCRPRLPGQLLVRALRKKFSWRLLDSQRGVVFAAKRKLVELQAAGCGGFVQEVALCCPAGWISIARGSVEYFFLQTMALRLLVLERQGDCFVLMLGTWRHRSCCHAGVRWLASCRSCRQTSAVVWRGAVCATTQRSCKS